MDTVSARCPLLDALATLVTSNCTYLELCELLDAIGGSSYGEGSGNDK